MKRFIRVIVVCFLFGMISGPARAGDPDQVIEQFFSMLKEGQAAEAVDFLYSGNKWIAKNSDAVTNVRNKLASLGELIGGLKNHEKLQEIKLGTRFVYASYLAAYERQPVRFVFEFYRPEETWIIFGFTLDDEVDEDVEQAAREDIAER